MGKVVGVTDGDTIKVVTADKTLYKVRLNAVDCPETGQPFGTTAKQFTSKFAFGKTAQVKVTDTDRYGRTVGVVTVDGKSLNQSLVKYGMAWWYRKYAPTDSALKQLEFEARQAKIGIWSDKTAVSPWEWRKGTRPAPKVAKSVTPTRGSSSYSGYSTAKATYGNPNSASVYITRTGAKYHEGGCRHLAKSQIAISLKDAEAQGYGACKHCH
jgi:endonuclease YncB( thermonuclease family)